MRELGSFFGSYLKEVEGRGLGGVGNLGLHGHFDVKYVEDELEVHEGIVSSPIPFTRSTRMEANTTITRHESRNTTALRLDVGTKLLPGNLPDGAIEGDGATPHLAIALREVLELPIGLGGHVPHVHAGDQPTTPLALEGMNTSLVINHHGTRCAKLGP